MGDGPCVFAGNTTAPPFQLLAGAWRFDRRDNRTSDDGLQNARQNRSRDGE